MIQKLRLSVSRVKLFEQCPQKYYYRYIENLPDPPNKYSALGSLFHKSAELFVQEYMKTNNLRESMVYAYQKAKDVEEIIKLEPYLERQDRNDVRDWLKQYVKYLEENPEETKKFYLTEKEINFKIKAPKIEINILGYIDRVDKEGEDKLIVADYKTGKSEYLESFQLIVYAAAIEELYKGKQVNYAQYELIKEGFRKQVYDVTAKEKKAALDRIIFNAKRILKLQDGEGQWISKPSALCNYCPYKVKCDQENFSSWDSIRI